MKKRNKRLTVRNVALIAIFVTGWIAALYVFSPRGWYTEAAERLHEARREARAQGYYDGFDDGALGSSDRIGVYKALFKSEYDQGYSEGLRAGGGYRRI